MLDLSNLPPSPWSVVAPPLDDTLVGPTGSPLLLADNNDAAGKAAIAFAALARAALDVAMRRKWSAKWWQTKRDEPSGWCVEDTMQNGVGDRSRGPDRNLPVLYADPFTALVEADRFEP